MLLRPAIQEISKAVTAKFTAEAKQIAEQKAKQAQNELRKAEIDAQQRIVTAQATKKATVLGAEAQAEKIRIVADAEAEYQKRIAESATAAGLKLRTIEACEYERNRKPG